MLSGDGAFQYGGRWNSPGRRAVYLGGSLALASMELLIHLRMPEVLWTYRKLRVRIPVGLIQDVDSRDLPSDWAAPSLRPPTREIGDRSLDSLQSAVLRVPSAFVIGEVNYILNPTHACTCQVETGRIEDFRYDSRILNTLGGR